MLVERANKNLNKPKSRRMPHFFSLIVIAQCYQRLGGRKAGRHYSPGMPDPWPYIVIWWRNNKLPDFLPLLCLRHKSGNDLVEINLSICSAWKRKLAWNVTHHFFSDDFFFKFCLIYCIDAHTLETDQCPLFILNGHLSIWTSVNKSNI